MKPIEVTDASFEAEVLQAKQPVLVDFWAVWCGPCRAVAPIVDEIAREYNGKLKVVKVDVDENQEISAKYGVSSIPTLMIFKEQVAVFSQPGALPAAAFDDLIGQARSLDMDEVRKAMAEQEQAATH